MRAIVIATPCYTGDVSAGYALSLLRTSIVGGLRGVNILPIMECGNAIVEHARNVLVARFLETPADTLLFVDSDLSWDEEAVFRMYESPYEVVGGTYPKKLQEGSQYLGHFAPNEEGDFIEATQLPAGFLMVRRTAFEKMAGKTAPEYYDPLLKRKNFAWFETCLRSGALNGEDFEFSERWKPFGKMWCYPDIYFEHTGRKIWAGNFKERLYAQSAQRSEHADGKSAGEIPGGSPGSSEAHAVSP